MLEGVYLLSMKIPQNDWTDILNSKDKVIVFTSKATAQQSIANILEIVKLNSI